MNNCLSKKLKLAFRVVAGLLILTNAATQIASAQLSSPVPVFSFQSNLSGLASDRIIHLPPSVGQVEEIYQGKRKEFVVLIQDAHSNYSAQKNIAAAIEFLSKKQKIDLVAVEGAHGEIDTEILRAFPSLAVTRKVLDRYVRKGEIGGPQFAVSLSRSPIKLIGVDEDKLYKKNLAEFVNVLEIQKDGVQIISEMNTELKRLTRTAFSEKHQAFDNLWANWKKGFVGTEKFVESLRGMGEVMGSRPEELRKFFKEIETVRIRIKESLSKSETERALIRRQEYTELLERGLKLELTRTELKRLRDLSEEFRPKDIRGREIHKCIFDFYRTAEERDALFVKRLQKEMASHMKRSSILVCGGFHSEGIAKLLEKAGYSYAIIQPKISGNFSRKNYFHLMQKNASLLHLTHASTLGVRVPLAENTFADTKLLISKIIEEEFKTVAENPARYGFGSLSEVASKWRDRGEIVVAGNQMWSPVTLRWALETWDHKFTGFGISKSSQRDKLVQGLELFGLPVPSGFGANAPPMQVSIDNLIETLKNDPNKDRRWSAMKSLAQDWPSSDKRNRALLHVLSDPHTMNRENATYYINQDTNFSEDLLLEFMKNPDVPEASDPRTENLTITYDPKVARRNVRLAGLFTLLRMFRFNDRPALPEKLKRLISDQAHEWVANGQKEIQDIDILDPLSAKNELSLFQILRLFVQSYQENNQTQLRQALYPMDHVKFFWAYQAVKKIYPNIIDDPIAPLIYKPVNDEAAKWMLPHYPDVGFGSQENKPHIKIIKESFDPVEVRKALYELRNSTTFPPETIFQALIARQDEQNNLWRSLFRNRKLLIIYTPFAAVLVGAIIAKLLFETGYPFIPSIGIFAAVALSIFWFFFIEGIDGPRRVTFSKHLSSDWDILLERFQNLAANVRTLKKESLYLNESEQLLDAYFNARRIFWESFYRWAFPIAIIATLITTQISEAYAAIGPSVYRSLLFLGATASFVGPLWVIIFSLYEKYIRLGEAWQKYQPFDVSSQETAEFVPDPRTLEQLARVKKETDSKFGSGFGAKPDEQTLAALQDRLHTIHRELLFFFQSARPYHALPRGLTRLVEAYNDGSLAVLGGHTTSFITQWDSDLFALHNVEPEALGDQWQYVARHLNHAKRLRNNLVIFEALHNLTNGKWPGQTGIPEFLDGWRRQRDRLREDLDWPSEFGNDRTELDQIFSLVESMLADLKSHNRRLEMLSALQRFRTLTLLTAYILYRENEPLSEREIAWFEKNIGNSEPPETSTHVTGFGAKTGEENAFDYSKDHDLKTIRESFDPTEIREAIARLNKSRKYPAQVISELLSEKESEHERFFYRSKIFSRKPSGWRAKVAEVLFAAMTVSFTFLYLMMPIALFGTSAAMTAKYWFYAGTLLLFALWSNISKMPLRLAFKINLSGDWNSLLERFQNLVVELFHLQADSIYSNESEKFFEKYFNARRNFWIAAYEIIPVVILAIAWIDSFLPHILRRITPPLTNLEVFLGSLIGMFVPVIVLFFLLEKKYLQSEEAWQRYNAAENAELRNATPFKSNKSKVRFLESAGVPYSKSRGWNYSPENTTALIAGLAEIPAKGSGFLGAGSFHNLDIALDRNAEVIMLVDRDREIVELNLKILRLIESTEHFDELYPAIQKLLETEGVMPAELFDQYVNNEKNTMGRTPLYWAKNVEDFNRLKSLISKGRVAVAHADFTRPSSFIDVYRFFENFSIPIEVINLGDVEGPGYAPVSQMEKIPEALSAAGAHDDTLIIASSSRSEHDFKKHFGDRAANVRFLTSAVEPAADENLVRFVSHHYVRTLKELRGGQLFIDSAIPTGFGAESEKRDSGMTKEAITKITDLMIKAYSWAKPLNDDRVLSIIDFVVGTIGNSSLGYNSVKRTEAFNQIFEEFRKQEFLSADRNPLIEGAALWLEHLYDFSTERRKLSPKDFQGVASVVHHLAIEKGISPAVFEKIIFYLRFVAATRQEDVQKQIGNSPSSWVLSILRDREKESKGNLLFAETIYFLLKTGSVSAIDVGSSSTGLSETGAEWVARTVLLRNQHRLTITPNDVLTIISEIYSLIKLFLPSHNLMGDDLSRSVGKVIEAISKLRDFGPGTNELLAGVALWHKDLAHEASIWKRYRKRSNETENPLPIIAARLKFKSIPSSHIRATLPFLRDMLASYQEIFYQTVLLQDGGATIDSQLRRSLRQQVEKSEEEARLDIEFIEALLEVYPPATDSQGREAAGFGAKADEKIASALSKRYEVIAEDVQFFEAAKEREMLPEELVKILLLFKTGVLARQDQFNVIFTGQFDYAMSEISEDIELIEQRDWRFVQKEFKRASRLRNNLIILERLKGMLRAGLSLPDEAGMESLLDEWRASKEKLEQEANWPPSQFRSENIRLDEFMTITDDLIWSMTDELMKFEDRQKIKEFRNHTLFLAYLQYESGLPTADRAWIEENIGVSSSAGFGRANTQIPEVVQAAVTHLENTGVDNFHSGTKIMDIRTLIFSGQEEAEGFAMAMKNEAFAANFSKVNSIIFAWQDPISKTTLKQQLKDVLPDAEIHAEHPEGALNLLTLASSALLVGEANPMILTETPPIVLEHMPNGDTEAITALVRAVRLQEKIQKLYRAAA